MIYKLLQIASSNRQKISIYFEMLFFVDEQLLHENISFLNLQLPYLVISKILRFASFTIFFQSHSNAPINSLELGVIVHLK